MSHVRSVILVLLCLSFAGTAGAGGGTYVPPIGGKNIFQPARGAIALSGKVRGLKGINIHGRSVHMSVPTGLGGEILLPPGDWTGVQIQIDGSVDLVGETADGMAYRVRVELSALEVPFDQPTSGAGASFHLDVELPAWMISSLPASGVLEIDADHPLHAAAVRAIEDGVIGVTR